MMAEVCRVRKTILITGASGLVGSGIIKRLLDEKKTEKKDIQILGVYHNVRPTLQNFESNDIIWIKADICDMESLRIIAFPIDYIIHCAAITQSRVMIEKPVEVSDSVVIGTMNILKFAKEKNIKSMVYLSSMEVYGQTECKEVKEADLGYIDLLSVRNCYPLAKRMSENLCYSYCQEYGVPVKIARLAQTFGPGTPKDDTRVFAQFARSVLNEDDIVLHTEGGMVGNYIDTEDCVEAILKLLEHGQNGEVYNIANPQNCMSVREMAEMVAQKIADNNINVIFDIPQSDNYGYPKPTGWRMNADKIMALGWRPHYTVEEMYKRMIESWK